MSHQLGIQTKKDDDFGNWYSELVQKSEMVMYSDISGCYPLCPRGYFAWETIQRILDGRLKSHKVRNCYFPILISEKVLSKEETHLEGFTPEVAWVTHAGSKPLEQRLAIRPTSETVIYQQMGKMIEKDRLPLKLNQWCNVIRWEFRDPTPFIRSREFLWQEGHTAHLTEEEATEMTRTMIIEYQHMYHNLLRVPTILGKKTPTERFAGADDTYTVEAYIPGCGKSIQAATSHMLGQNFSKMFNLFVQDERMKKSYLYQTSWGFTTRSIGIALMVHSDDTGVILPTDLCETQIVVVPIYRTKNKETVLEYAGMVSSLLENADYRVELDLRNKKPGWKYNYWELRGVPYRIEVGGRDMEAESVTVCERLNRNKKSVKLDHLLNYIPEFMAEYDEELYIRAEAKMSDAILINPTGTKEELFEMIKDGKIVYTGWCGSSDCEMEVRKNCEAAKSLCIPERAGFTPSECFCCGEKADLVCAFGRSL